MKFEKEKDEVFDWAESDEWYEDDDEIMAKKMKIEERKGLEEWERRELEGDL
jgi:hypothetical protein